MNELIWLTILYCISCEIILEMPFANNKNNHKHTCLYCIIQHPHTLNLIEFFFSIMILFEKLIPNEQVSKTQTYSLFNPHHILTGNHCLHDTIKTCEIIFPGRPLMKQAHFLHSLFSGKKSRFPRLS